MNTTQFVKTNRIFILLIVFLIFTATIGIIYIHSVHMNNGHFAYFLDDAYIHLAVAKHLAQNGVFGITKYSFSSSVSSILWPLLEGLVMKIVGVNDLIPLYLNIVFGNLLLLVSFIILKKT